MNRTPYSHFYLYSKGWYKKNNIEDDLKKILSNYTWIDEKFLTLNDVMLVLSEVVFWEIQNSGNPLNKFQKYSSDVVEKGILQAGLSVLNVSVVDFAIKSPDSEVLPLAEEK